MIFPAIKTITSLTAEQQVELIKLFVEADFTEVLDDGDWLNTAIANSLIVLGAFDENNHLVGFARALGDGVSDCYIQDVVVDASCRNQGIGRQLVDTLCQQLADRGIDWIGLIATPGKADFYRKLGFEELREFVPMRKKNKI